MAHELNSPLQAILTEAEGLLLDVARGVVSEEVLGESMEIIRTTAMHAGKITMALRALSRESRDDDEAGVAVETLWAHVRVLCASNASVAGVTLHLADVEQGLTVRAHEGDTLQALLAVVNNGIEACRDSDAAEPWVKLEAHAVDDAVVLCCLDAGPGVPERHEVDIFAPWYTTKPPGASTGLGLAVARRLIERNDGVLNHVVGAPHTTFEIRLVRARRGTGDDS